MPLCPSPTGHLFKSSQLGFLYLSNESELFPFTSCRVKGDAAQGTCQKGEPDISSWVCRYGNRAGCRESSRERLTHVLWSLEPEIDWVLTLAWNIWEARGSVGVPLKLRPTGDTTGGVSYMSRFWKDRGADFLMGLLATLC